MSNRIKEIKKRYGDKHKFALVEIHQHDYLYLLRVAEAAIKLRNAEDYHENGGGRSDSSWNKVEKASMNLDRILGE